MKHQHFLIYTLAVAVGLTAGCSKKAKKAKNPAGAVGVTAGLVVTDASAYHQAVEEGVKVAAERQKMKLVVEEAQGRVSEQTRAVEQLLQANTSIILVSPLEPEALRPVLQKAAEQKIPVVALERTVPDAAVTSFIQFNQTLAGQLCADYIAHRLKSGGTIGILKGLDTPDQQERIQAFREHLQKKRSTALVVGEETASGEAAEGSAVDRLLQAHPDLSAVFATSDSLAMAATRELRGRSAGGKKCFVVSYGGGPEAVEELTKKGSPLAMIATIQPQRLGRAALRLAARIVSNRKTRARSRLPILPITQDNYGTYPGYDGELPRDAPVPWPSELELKGIRE